MPRRVVSQCSERVATFHGCSPRLGWISACSAASCSTCESTKGVWLVWCGRSLHVSGSMCFYCSVEDAQQLITAQLPSKVRCAKGIPAIELEAFKLSCTAVDHGRFTKCMPMHRMQMRCPGPMQRRTWLPDYQAPSFSCTLFQSASHELLTAKLLTLAARAAFSTWVSVPANRSSCMSSLNSAGGACRTRSASASTILSLRHSTSCCAR